MGRTRWKPLSRILIIDDEKDLVSLLDKKLKKNGHEVLTAKDLSLIHI